MVLICCIDSFTMSLNEPLISTEYELISFSICFAVSTFFIVEHPIYTNPSIVSRTFFNFFGVGFCMTIQFSIVIRKVFCYQGGFCMTIQLLKVLYDNTKFRMTKKRLYDNTYNRFLFCFYFIVVPLLYPMQFDFPSSCSKILSQNIVRLLLHSYHLVMSPR